MSQDEIQKILDKGGNIKFLKGIYNIFLDEGILITMTPVSSGTYLTLYKNTNTTWIAKNIVGKWEAVSS